MSMPVSALGGISPAARPRYAAGGRCLLLATRVCALLIPWVTKDIVDALGARGARPRPRDGRRRRPYASGSPSSRPWSARCPAWSCSAPASGWRPRSGRSVRHVPQARPRPSTRPSAPGDLMSRATHDLQSVSMLVGFGFLSVVNTVVVYAGTLSAMLPLDPLLTLVALLPYPLLVGASTASTREPTPRAWPSSSSWPGWPRGPGEPDGMAVVRAYTHGAARNPDVRRPERGAPRPRRAPDPHPGRLLAADGIMGGIGALTVLWLGGRAVMDGRLSLGALVAFTSYLGYLAWPTMALAWVLALVRRGFTALGRVIEILDTPTVVAPPGPRPRRPGPTACAGRSSSAGWPSPTNPTGRRPCRMSASRCRPGDRRHRRPDGVRQVHVARAPGPALGPAAGHDLPRRPRYPHCPLDELRAQVGVVPQEAFLFSRSDDNVLLGGPETRLAEAGRVSGLWPGPGPAPEGWQTVVGERGLTLSGRSAPAGHPGPGPAGSPGPGPGRRLRLGRRRPRGRDHRRAAGRARRAHDPPDDPSPGRRGGPTASWSWTAGGW